MANGDSNNLSFLQKVQIVALIVSMLVNATFIFNLVGWVYDTNYTMKQLTESVSKLVSEVEKISRWQRETEKRFAIEDELKKRK